MNTILAQVSMLCTMYMTSYQDNSFIEFEVWKEKEEEATYTAYVKGQKSYIPKSNETG